MIQIDYSIGTIKTSMLVSQEHYFQRTADAWVQAKDLAAGDKIHTTSGGQAEILQLKQSEDMPSPNGKKTNLITSHNHHYFTTRPSPGNHDTPCNKAPTDALEQIPYTLANKPSHGPDGKPTGDHAGPWVAARYVDVEFKIEAIGWGRADNDMCAEDAAVNNLRQKLGDTIKLHRANVKISHAYIRKYSKKGRIVNTMSPCTQCRNNYGNALSDKTLGTSDLTKKGRGYLPAI